QEPDRTSEIVERAWAPLWSRVAPQRPIPPIEPAPLLHAGLAAAREAEGRREFTLHPMIADVGRAQADEAFAAAVDEVLGNFWVVIGTQASTRGGPGSARQVAAAGRRGAPYLLRARRWDYASTLLERAVAVGAPDPASVTELLPHLRALVNAT